MTISKAVREEMQTMFRDPQVETVAVTKNGTVLACIWFNRYGLNEVGIYKITPSIEPRRIIKKSPRVAGAQIPRVWEARVYLMKIAKRIGATLITNDVEMQKFLATEKSA